MRLEENLNYIRVGWGASVHPGQTEIHFTRKSITYIGDTVMDTSNFVSMSGHRWCELEVL
jgi:hypothetical protein